MPTISNLQGNLRLNSGVFEVFQGTGIIPNLYTTSVIAPSAVITGQTTGQAGRTFFYVGNQLYVKVSSSTTGWYMNLAFNNTENLKYHYDNQYWVLMTGSSASGPFFQYTGAEAVQYGSTGVSIDRSRFPASFHAKAKILPLNINQRLDRIRNNGTFAVNTADSLNIGNIDTLYRSDKLNISGNINIASTNPNKYLKLQDPGKYEVYLNVLNGTGNTSLTQTLPNVLVGQGNTIDLTAKDLSGNNAYGNYVFGKNNIVLQNILGTPNFTGLFSENHIIGSNNRVTGSDQASIFGTNNVLSFNDEVYVYGNNNSLDSVESTNVLGNYSNIKNVDFGTLIGANNVIINSGDNLAVLVLGNSNSVVSGKNDTNNLLIIGNGHTINSPSGTLAVSLIGQANSIQTITSQPKNVMVYGNSNALGSNLSDVKLFGSKSFIENGVSTFVVGDSQSLSDTTTAFVNGVENTINSGELASVIGTRNTAFLNNQSVVLGHFNILGNGPYFTSGRKIYPSIKSGIKIQNVQIGSNNENYLDQSQIIGNTNKSYSVNNSFSGRNSIILGSTNFSSGSENIILGNTNTVRSVNSNPYLRNVALGISNTLHNSNSSTVVGYGNTISGNTELINNYAFGINNRFINSQSNVAIGYGNLFSGETGKIKISAGAGTDLEYTAGKFDVKNATVYAGNVVISGGTSKLNLGERMLELENSKILSRFDDDFSSIFTVTRSGSGPTVFTISDPVSNTDYEPVKMPAQIEVSNCITGIGTSPLAVTGIYDLYYFPTYGKFNTLGAVKAIDPTGGVSYGNFISGKAPYLEMVRAQAVYDYQVQQGELNGVSFVNRPYYFYGKFEAPNKYAIISYTPAFTSGILNYNPAVPNFTLFKGVWALYTGTGYQYNDYTKNNRPVLINLYNSGQFETNLSPNSIPLFEWYGSGTWLTGALGQKVTGSFAAPSAPIGNSPITLRPVVDTRRVRFISVALDYENSVDKIPGAFMPVYY